jgi:hypothetical protein
MEGKIFPRLDLGLVHKRFHRRGRRDRGVRRILYKLF